MLFMVSFSCLAFFIALCSVIVTG
uniref:Uncharacterized protein n=1 Tax=Arundo donax TaxID=35708 RepID=A0A0A9ENP3_ARUDO